jgi:ribosomal-protein-alanine N-acetyltransferase
MSLSPGWAPPRVRTERLLVRPFTVDDLESVRAYVREYPADTYGSWLGGNSSADVARYLADTIARYGRPPRCDLGLEVDHRLVGGLAFRQVWISPPSFEIGWVIHPALAGRGFVREAVDGLLHHLFAAFPSMERAEARVRTTDISGVRLLEGFGFVREGVLRGGAGGAGDAALYGLLRSEWRPAGAGAS